MTHFVVDKIKTPRSVWNKGNGHVLTTDYESISITLDKELTNEAGSLVFADPGTINAGDVVELNIGFNDVSKADRSAAHAARCCDCTIDGCVHLEIPDPIPDDLAGWIADMFRRYSMFIANVLGSIDSAATGTINYEVIRPGWQIVVESNVDGLLTQSVTTQASAGGSLPSIGDGSALFIKVDRNIMTIPGPNPRTNFNTPGVIRPLKAATGYASADPIPCFFGVLRAKDRWVDECDLPCCVPKHDCPEAVRKGTIQIPLEEKAPDSYPECPTVAARYLADGTITETGGFRILGAADALPAGMIAIPSARAEIMMVHPDGMSAVLKLH